MEHRHLTVSDCDSDIIIKIEGQCQEEDRTDLILEAIVTLIEGLNSEDNVSMEVVENEIFFAFCDLLKRNHKYPEEITNKEIIKDFMVNYLEKA